MSKLGKRKRAGFLGKILSLVQALGYFLGIFTVALIIIMVVVPGSWESKIEKIKEFGTSVKSSYTKDFYYESNELDTINTEKPSTEPEVNSVTKAPNKIETIKPSENVDYEIPKQETPRPTQHANINASMPSPNVNDPKALSKSWYYSQLDDTGKRIYSLIKDQSSYLLKGNHTFDYHGIFTDLLSTPEGKQSLERSFQAAINAITLDYPQLFFLNVDRVQLQYTTRGVLGSSVKILNSPEGLYFAEGLNTREEVAKVRNDIDNVVNQIVRNANAREKTTIGKIRYVHDILIDSIEYDDSETNIAKHNLYGALLNGRAVCEGYAKAFKYIMDRMGIPTITVVGMAINSTGDTQRHAWNQVYINGAWYGIDTTWDDPLFVGPRNSQTVPDKYKYKYFLVGEREFRGNHVPNGNVSPDIYFKYPPLPNSRLQIGR